MKADKRAPGILADDRPHRMGAIGQISDKRRGGGGADVGPYAKWVA
jgi:hypothetical protein